MPPHAYILRCGDGTLYVGSARNLESRLEQHAAGLGGQYTAKRQPVVLVYAEEFERIDEAWAREKQLQGWSRAKREALIKGRFQDLVELSRNRQSDGS
jgi:putative endonuclease